MTWYEPRWAYTRKLWLQLYDVINSASLCRIALLSAALSAVVVACFQWAVPQFVVPNLWPAIMAFPSLLLLLVFHIGLLTLVPPAVTIRPDWIQVQHGQGNDSIAASDVTSTRLTFHPEDRVRLRICYLYNTRPRTRSIGVPPHIDFRRLAELLPVKPTIRDARDRAFVSSVPTREEPRAIL